MWEDDYLENAFWLSSDDELINVDINVVPYFLGRLWLPGGKILMAKCRMFIVERECILNLVLR